MLHSFRNNSRCAHCQGNFSMATQRIKVENAEENGRLFGVRCRGKNKRCGNRKQKWQPLDISTLFVHLLRSSSVPRSNGRSESTKVEDADNDNIDGEFVEFATWKTQWKQPQSNFSSSHRFHFAFLSLTSKLVAFKIFDLVDGTTERISNKNLEKKQNQKRKIPSKNDTSEKRKTALSFDCHFVHFANAIYDDSYFSSRFYTLIYLLLVYVSGDGHRRQ